ncbi:MAG TPA: exosortase [Methylomirabilota bacterium]
MKSTRETILRNTFWYGLVTGLGLVAGLLMSIMLARGLGPARMGDYSYLLWLLRTMTAIATLGFALATTRYTASALAQGEPRRAAAYLQLLSGRQLVASALVAAAFLPLIMLFAPADLFLPLLIITVGLIPVTLEGIYSHAAYGAQRYDITTQVSTLKMTLHLLAAIVVLSLGGGILGLTAGGLLGTTISALVIRKRARALYPTPDRPISGTQGAELTAYLIPLSAVAVLDALVWDRSEVFFLRLYASSAQIAFYSVAFGLASRGMVAAEVAAGTLLPALASLHGRGAHEEFGRVYRAALRWVALVGAPIAAIGGALAPDVVTLLYGAPYLPVAALLVPMLVVSVVGVLRTVAWAALRATGDQRWALHATWISASLNIGAAVVLIPRLGAWGAVMANATAQLIASLLAFVAVARRERCGFPAFDLARIAVAAVAAHLTARAVAPAGHQSLAGFLIAVVLGGAVFVASAIGIGALGWREWALVSTAYRRVPRRAIQIGLGAVATLLLLTLYAPIVRDLASVWATIPYYSYGFLIPLFSAWIIWDARARLTAPQPGWSPAGVALLGAGVVLLEAATVMQSLTLAALSLPCMLGGAARLLLGRERARALVFPLAFLVFMAPLPQNALPAVSLPLQHLAAWVAGHALATLGVPSTRIGLDIYMPGVVMNVSEACNGLRFLLAMLVVGTAFAWTTQARTSRRLAVVTLAVLVAISANLVRVTGTGLLAHYWGPQTAAGFFHMAYGKVVYLVMLVPFVAGVLFLRRHRFRSASNAL